MKTKIISFRVDENQASKIHQVAQRLGVSTSKAMQQIVDGVELEPIQSIKPVSRIATVLGEMERQQ